jgi:DNA-directed RNA polymerase subunit RPC12/RpoP
MVAEDQLLKAADLLDTFGKEKREQFVCPDCGSGIEHISSNRDPANWLSVMLGFLAFGYAMPVKTWKCFDCKKEFKEPHEKHYPANDDEA